MENKSILFNPSSTFRSGSPCRSGTATSSLTKDTHPPCTVCPARGRCVSNSRLSSANAHFRAEVEAYERFTRHGNHPPASCTTNGLDPDDPAGTSVVLELAKKGNQHKYLWDSRIFSHPPPSPATLYRWVRQAAEGLAFAHSCGVLHSDIRCVNFLLDGALNLKAADFTGASIGGGKSWSTYRLTNRLLFAEPKGDSSSLRMDIMTVSEIFGLGSVLYSMVIGHDLFPEMDYTRDRAEIAWRLRQRRFSDIRELSVVRSVVTRCWNVEYDSMVNVIEGIDAESGLFAGRSMV
jgi:serine/threonine protein kinase